MRVLTVVGARPQFVKAAPVSRALRTRAEEVLVHTGQHYDDVLSAAFFRDLEIPAPDVHLGVGSGAPGPRLAAMIRGVAQAIRDREPDVVLVFGDTDSTLAGALAAREAGTRLVHVEAGMRSGEAGAPEEVNRIATDHLSDLLLATTASAAETLRAERARGRVEVVGDPMLDVCLAEIEAARSLDVPASLGLVEGGYLAATLHRAENTDVAARLATIVRTLDGLGLPVVLPCHPRTRKALNDLGLGDDLHALRLVEPLSYRRMLGLIAGARGVLTDSGGLQKEAFYVGVPCATLRDATEWTETVTAGWNTVVGADPDRIRAAVAAFGAPRPPRDLATFGNGGASEAVARCVTEFAR